MVSLPLPRSEPRPKRFSIDEYHQLIETGVLSSNDRIELIQGEIIEMAAKGTAHTVCCQRLLRILPPLLSANELLRCQDPITLYPQRSEPEPDLVIATARTDDYLTSHPSPADILLLIEVSDSSLDYDRQAKGKLYAEAGIEIYWIFNLLDRQLEIHTHPQQTPNNTWHYSQTQILLPSQSITIPISTQPNLSLNNLFP